MKKLLAFLICAALSGCMINPPKSGKWPPGGDMKMADPKPEAKLADKLPLGVMPESVTQENAAAKSRELQAELDRAAKNLAAARADSNSVK